jgi:hypothetical protein
MVRAFTQEKMMELAASRVTLRSAKYQIIVSRHWLDGAIIWTPYKLGQFGYERMSVMSRSAERNFPVTLGRHAQALLAQVKESQ